MSESKFSKPPTFTIDAMTDASHTQMPSITKLLDRKKLQTDPEKRSAALARRWSNPSCQELDIQTLKSLTSDPVNEGIVSLFERGAYSALFFERQTATADNSSASKEVFTSARMIEAKDRASLWKDMQWNTAATSEIWGVFEKAGYLEVPPPAFHRKVGGGGGPYSGYRVAFGLKKDEWLTLIVTGSEGVSKETCPGVVVLISKQSLKTAISGTKTFSRTGQLKKAG